MFLLTVIAFIIVIFLCFLFDCLDSDGDSKIDEDTKDNDYDFWV